MICIWSSWCHCHPIISSLALVKYRMVYLSGEKRPWNGCSITGLKSNKHNCVLSNAGLSNAPTKTGFCTSLKSGFYFRFYSPSNTKSALPNFISSWDLMLSCWKVCSPEPENCRNQNSHTCKIGNLLPVCVTNRRSMRRRSWTPCKIWWKAVKNCGRNT